MIQKTIEIENELGLHSRVAASFVQICSKYKSEIFIKKDEFEINAKSIMGIMALGASNGENVGIVIDGPDEEEAMEEIVMFFKNLVETD